MSKYTITLTLRKPEDDAGIREPDFKKAFEMTNLKRDERP